MNLQTHNQSYEQTTRKSADEITLITSSVRGALAGVIATIPMTWALQGIDTRLDDELIANIAHKTGYPIDGDGRQLTTYVSRFAFGACAGILFALTPKIKSVRPEFRGPLFGLFVWAASSAVKQIARPKSKMSPAETQLLMIASHFAWGVAISRLVNHTAGEILIDAYTGLSGQTSASRMVRRFVV